MPDQQRSFELGQRGTQSGDGDRVRPSEPSTRGNVGQWHRSRRGADDLPHRHGVTTAAAHDALHPGGIVDQPQQPNCQIASPGDSRHCAQSPDLGGRFQLGVVEQLEQDPQRRLREITGRHLVLDAAYLQCQLSRQQETRHSADRQRLVVAFTEENADPVETQRRLARFRRVDPKMGGQLVHGGRHCRV